MNNKIKHILACIIPLVLLIGIVLVMSKIVERKDSYIKFADFLEEEEEFDAWFFGSSHAICAIYPMEIWNDYGIVSYNLASHGCRIPTSCATLELALQYSKPKVVVIDCYNLTSDRLYSDSVEHAHLTLDAFPLSKVKIQKIDELFETNKLKLEFAFNFITYHNRWKDITTEDIRVQTSPNKGADILIQTATPNPIIYVSKENKFEENTNATEYLDKMIQLCKEQDIEVVLTYIPFPANEQEWKEANRTYEIAEKWDVEYINFLVEDVVDYNTDCADPGSHLNYYGGSKVTHYLGEYLHKNFELEDKRSDPQYQHWWIDYKEYIDTLRDRGV